MANKLEEKIASYWKKLPNSLSGNGQNFVFLLKEILQDLSTDLDSKFQEVSKIANEITDAPDEMAEQLQNCTVTESRVGDAVSLTLRWDYNAIKNYDSAEIYVKETSETDVSSIKWASVPVSRSIRTTKTNKYILDNVNIGHAYQITFLGKNTFGTLSSKDKAPVLVYVVSNKGKAPEPPENFFVYFDKEGALWKWTEPEGISYSYSELRTDENVGNKVGLLEITQDLQSRINPPVREGTAYLYNKGGDGKYSLPASIQWSKPIPTPPSNISCTEFEKGLQISFSDIPEDCSEAVISINGKKYSSSTSLFTYYCPNGTYKVKCCFTDIFGEGKWSDETEVTTTLNTSEQKDLTVGNVSATEIGTNELTATTIKADIGDIGELSSKSITTTSLSADEASIKKVTSDKITTDNLSANTIKASTSVQVVGENVLLDKDGLTAGGSNNEKTVYSGSGATYYDSNGNPYQTIKQFCMGQAKNGDYVKLSPEWTTTPHVMVFPLSVVTSNVNIPGKIQRIHCYADNITKQGFNVHVFESVDEESFKIDVNNTIINATQKVWRSMDNAGPWTGSFSVDLPANVEVINISFTVWGKSHYSYSDKCISLDDTSTSYITLYADSKLIYSGTPFITTKVKKQRTSSKSHHTSTYYVYEYGFAVGAESENSKTVSLGDMRVNHPKKITGNVRLFPHVVHPGDDGNDMQIKFTVNNITGYRDSNTVKQVLDSNSTATFIAVGNPDTGYSIT